MGPSLIQTENTVNMPNGASYTMQSSTTNGDIVTTEVTVITFKKPQIMHFFFASTPPQTAAQPPSPARAGREGLSTQTSGTTTHRYD